MPLKTAHFSRAVGLFSRDALNARAEIVAKDALNRFGFSKSRFKNGTAPILFLKPRAAAKDADPTCGFLVNRGGTGEAARLECGLGLDGMPLSCSLYPLGHFLRADESGADFFTVDAGKCEGVGASASEANKTHDTGVGDFLSRNSLVERLAAADAVRGLVTAYACTGIEQATVGSPRARDILSADSQMRLPPWVREALAARVHEEMNMRGPTDVPALLIVLRDRVRALWEAPRSVAAAAGVENAQNGDWSDRAADALLTATAELIDEWTSSVLHK